MKKVFAFIFLLLFLACNEQQTKQQKKTEENNHFAETNQSAMYNMIASNDSIIVTARVYGKKSRMNILQQKVTFMAKKRLADTVAIINKMIDTIAEGHTLYNIKIEGIHIIEEGFRYPDKTKQDQVEAYMTIGIKNPNKAN